MNYIETEKDQSVTQEITQEIGKDQSIAQENIQEKIIE